MKTGYEKALRWFAACLIVASGASVSVLAAEADFDQLRDKYYADHPGKGNFGDLWEPIAIQKYWNPIDFYTPPDTIRGKFTRGQCVDCHQGMTPGWVHAWRDSAHGNLDGIRNLDPEDSRFYPPVA